MLDTNVVGLRVVATFVDWVLLAIVFFAEMFFFASFSAAFAGPGESALDSLFQAFWAIAAVISFFAYYIVFEGLRGQTPGKMMVGIRVVRKDTAGTPGFGAATVRTLLRFVDGISAYLVAFIVAELSPENQRLGDMSAHTLVVRY
jgi:uncharacterized RDD family membrane protein YckC